MWRLYVFAVQCYMRGPRLLAVIHEHVDRTEKQSSRNIRHDNVFRHLITSKTSHNQQYCRESSLGEHRICVEASAALQTRHRRIQ